MTRVPYRLDRFGLADSVRAAAELRAAAESSATPAAAAEAVVRRLDEAFVGDDGRRGLRWVRWYAATEAADEPLVGEIARRLSRPDPVAVASRFDVDGPVIGFGGALGGGRTFVVVLAPAGPVEERFAEWLAPVAAGVRSGLLAHAAADGNGGSAAWREALREQLHLVENAIGGHGAELARDVGRLSADAEVVGLLQAVGRRLMAQLDLDALVQDATETATKATGAAFGAFFYNLIDDNGESYTLYTLAGVPRAAFERFPMPRNTKVFAPTFSGEGTVRVPDITADPRYGHNPPHHGMPAGHLPVRSYLAVPVVSPTSHEVLGGFFFGHPRPDRFQESHERLAEGIAGYAAIALDNARLYARQRGLATELQRSMLPAIPEVPGFTLVSRYLPAGAGSEVGGDWIDVIELPAGRTAFVVGDVQGRGVAAAAVMGQVRTAVRSYALLDLPPADVLRNASDLAATMPRQPFVTCVYAVHDPADGTLTYANAGHPAPALVEAAGPVTLLGERLGQPLGVGRSYEQREVHFPPGAAVALYTDGLVEQRGRPLDHGLLALAEALKAVAPVPAGDLEAACDGLLRQVTGAAHGDDVALLYVRNADGPRRAVAMTLDDDPAYIAAQARRFIRNTMASWHLDDTVDAAATIGTELVTNAIRHAAGPVRLRLHQTGDRLVIDVGDRDQRLPRRFDPAPHEEHHRGLFLVDAFADRWGTRPTPDGKVVWAELAVPERS